MDEVVVQSGLCSALKFGDIVRVKLGKQETEISHSVSERQVPLLGLEKWGFRHTFCGKSAHMHVLCCAVLCCDSVCVCVCVCLCVCVCVCVCVL
jgi:hypothetical protein